MIILGIETSCDETSIAVIKGQIEDGKVVDATVLSSCTFSQADIHAVFGGVVPEVASRNHMLKIVPLYNKALGIAGISATDVDMFAVTNAPGLIGALFVGVSFAKGLAYSLKKPVVPVNHLSGHILSAELSNRGLDLPYGAVVTSGGHTHIYDVYYDSNNKVCFDLLGRTIDDACGEAFDKVSVMLEGGYPGGPYVEKLASCGDPFAVKFPIALKDKPDFSFSGLKTAVMNKISKHDETPENIAASFQHTVAVTVADKAIRLCLNKGRKNIVVTGGVACNGVIREVFEDKATNNGMKVFFPEKSMCNDNAAMIAYAALKLAGGDKPELYLDYSFKAGDTAHEIVTAG